MTNGCSSRDVGPVPHTPVPCLLSAAETREEVLGMDGLGEDLELVSLIPCTVEEIGGRGLP